MTVTIRGKKGPYIRRTKTGFVRVRPHYLKKPKRRVKRQLNRYTVGIERGAPTVKYEREEEKTDY